MQIECPARLRGKPFVYPERLVRIVLRKRGSAVSPKIVEPPVKRVDICHIFRRRPEYRTKHFDRRTDRGGRVVLKGLEQGLARHRPFDHDRMTLAVRGDQFDGSGSVSGT